MSLSHWETNYYSKIDHVVLGAGIVGLSCAINLKKLHPMANICVIDRSWPPLGASTKNAGFMCFGSPSEILDDIDHVGEEMAMNIFEKRWRGRQELFSLIGGADIEYEQIGGLELYNVDNLPTDLEIARLNALIDYKIGVSSYFKEKTNLTLPAFSHVSFVAREEGRINPMKLMVSLKHQADEMGIIFIFKEVLKIERGSKKVIFIGESSISFGTLFVTLNAFASKYIPELEDVKPARNIVVVTSPLSHFNLDHVVHIDKGYIYMRMVGKRLLLGGARNKFGVGEYTDQLTVNHDIQSYLTNYITQTLNVLENFSIEASWAGILGVGSNKNPILKAIDDHTFVGVRMGGMGVAIGALVGKKLANQDFSP